MSLEKLKFSEATAMSVYLIKGMNMSFPTMADFVGNTNLTLQQSTIVVNPNYSFAGLTATSLSLDPGEPPDLSAVPDPAAAFLLLLGLAGWADLGARRRSKAT